MLHAVDTFGHIQYHAFDPSELVLTVVGVTSIEMLKKLNLGFVEQTIKKICNYLDHILIRCQKKRCPSRFVAAYQVFSYNRETGLKTDEFIAWFIGEANRKSLPLNDLIILVCLH